MSITHWSINLINCKLLTIKIKLKQKLEAHRSSENILCMNTGFIILKPPLSAIIFKSNYMSVINFNIRLINCKLLVIKLKLEQKLEAHRYSSKKHIV